MGVVGTEPVGGAVLLGRRDGGWQPWVEDGTQSHSRQETALGANAGGAEAKARGRGCVALFSWTGSHSAPGVGQKEKGIGDSVESRQSSGLAALLQRPSHPEPALLNISAWKTDTLADPVDAESLASRICYSEFPERPPLGTPHTQRPWAFLSPVPGSTHPCCLCSDQT